jgi:hypothetical protein
MFKSFLLALALLFGVATSAEASVGHRFVIGVNSPQQLAILVSESLARDASGNSVISEQSCKLRACGTPSDLLAMFQRSNPNITLHSVNQIPKYLNSLVIQKAPEGGWWMACKTGNGNAASATKWDCLSRKFHPGETVYVDPLTFKPVMARDCSNPVGEKDVPVKCVYLHAILKPGDEIHYGWLGTDAFPKGDCIPALLKAGESEEWSNTLLDECPRDKCDFSGPSRDLNGAKVWAAPRISFKAEIAGDYILRLPAGVTKSKSLFVLCVIHADGSQTRSNFMYAVTYWHNNAYATYGTDPIPGWDGGVSHPWMHFPSGEMEH